MNTSITFDRIRFFAYHGVMEQERKVGNIFEVSLTIQYPFGKALVSDCLDDTLNYAALYDVVAAEMAIPSNLLEHVVGRIICHIRKAFPLIQGGKITLAKLTPPIKGEMASVSVTVEF